MCAPGSHATVGEQSTTSWSVALYPVSSSNSRRAATRASSSGPPAVVAALSKPEDRVDGQYARARGGGVASTNRLETLRGERLRRSGKGGMGPGVPTTCLSSGGRYCSRMTVDRGKAFVLDLRMAKIATATEGVQVTNASGGGVREGDRPSFPVWPCTTLRSAHSQTRCPLVCPLARCERAARNRAYLFTVLVLIVDLGQRDEPGRGPCQFRPGAKTTHFEWAFSRGSVERTLGSGMVWILDRMCLIPASLPKMDAIQVQRLPTISLLVSLAALFCPPTLA